MGSVVAYNGGGVRWYWGSRLGNSRSRIVSFCGAQAQAAGGLRWQVLEQVDKELSNGDERAALSLVKYLQGKPHGLRCFGAARQVPQRLYTLDELKLNGIETSSLLSPEDATLGAIEKYLQIAALLGVVSARTVFGFSPEQLLYLSVGFLFLGTVDSLFCGSYGASCEGGIRLPGSFILVSSIYFPRVTIWLIQVSFGGGVGSLILDTIGHTISQKYHNRVIQHEAGHFLIAYLLGILPRGFTLSSLEALKKEGSLNVQAGTAFVDFEFLEEVNSGKVSATMLNRFSCVALAGVATEYLLYGYAEGGLSDINTLDGLLKSLGFTQKKADSQVRWAVLNTILILRRHEEVRVKLAQAMSEGKSVGSCIDIIENTIDDTDL